jgi:hypothetical protein
VNGLYNKNYKTVMKETEEDTKKCKDNPSSWIRRINIVRKSTLPKMIHKPKAILIKISMTFFTGQQQKNTLQRTSKNNPKPHSTTEDFK